MAELCIQNLKRGPHFCHSWAQFHQQSTYSFYALRSRMRKKRQSRQPLGPTRVKAAHKMLVKLTPGLSFQQTCHKVWLLKFDPGMTISTMKKMTDLAKVPLFHPSSGLSSSSSFASHSHSQCASALKWFRLENPNMFYKSLLSMCTETY
jgi:hypothetical protein